MQHQDFALSCETEFHAHLCTAREVRLLLSKQRRASTAMQSIAPNHKRCRVARLIACPRFEVHADLLIVLRDRDEFLVPFDVNPAFESVFDEQLVQLRTLDSTRLKSKSLQSRGEVGAGRKWNLGLRHPGEESSFIDSLRKNR